MIKIVDKTSCIIGMPSGKRRHINIKQIIIGAKILHYIASFSRIHFPDCVIILYTAELVSIYVLNYIISCVRIGFELAV